MPHIDAYSAERGRVTLVLDGRLGLALSETEACAVVPFVAACIETATRKALDQKVIRGHSGLPGDHPLPRMDSNHEPAG